VTDALGRMARIMMFTRICFGQLSVSRAAHGQNSVFLMLICPDIKHRLFKAPRSWSPITGSETIILLWVSHLTPRGAWYMKKQVSFWC
jgi:hypothetical protein